MKQPTPTDYIDYQKYVDNLYSTELDQGAKFLMNTSLAPAILSSNEVQGFIDRYNTIKSFWSISQDLFKNALFDPSLMEIRNLILNEVNSEFGLQYHQNLYKQKVDLPYFFRTDESIPGKITEIQSPGSGWGTLQALQTSIQYLEKFMSFDIRSFNKVHIAENVSEIIKELTHNNPFVFHQVDESSIMLDTNYFISTTRKHGLKYLGHDFEVTLKNANFIRTHSFLEQATGSTFLEFLNRFHNEELIFDIFPSILFFQKISLIFPFWEKTKHLYSDSIRNIFPFTSLVADNLQLEDGTLITPEDFCDRKPHERDYYLKYAGTDGTINWGSKAVYHLGKTDWKKCKIFLQAALEGYHNKHYWILQKTHHKKELVASVKDGVLNSQESYAKWSGFYGPKGFMGGYVMTREFYKVHGQNDTVCRLLL